MNEKYKKLNELGYISTGFGGIWTNGSCSKVNFYCGKTNIESVNPYYTIFHKFIYCLKKHKT